VRRLLGTKVQLVGARRRDGRKLFLERRRHFGVLDESPKASGSIFGRLRGHETQRNSLCFDVAPRLGSREAGDAHPKFRAQPNFHASGFFQRAVRAKSAMRTSETRASRLHSIPFL
jgi:hypothetical protein